MTLVEFSDVSPLQNLSGVIHFNADTLILVGSNQRQLEARKRSLRRVLDRVRPDIRLTLFPVKKYDIHAIILSLFDLAKREQPVIFDVSGGDDYILAAVGAAYQMAKEKGMDATLSHYSIRSGQLATDLPLDSFLPKQNINLTCDELIELHGGKIVYADRKKNGTSIPRFEKNGFGRDLDILWQLCKSDSRTWNKNAARLGEFESFAAICAERKHPFPKHRDTNGEPKSLDVSVDMSDIRHSRKGQLAENLEQHFRNLASYGLIKNYVQNDKKIAFTYKNADVRSCLVKAGTVFELYVYRAAMDTKYKNGRNVYHDGRTGVILDWDGVIHTGNNAFLDTENEIDVFLARGMIPVFVSCKNGGADENELYKLHAVAEHFGIKYAKKVLIATDLQKNYNSLKNFLARADAMHITVIDGVHRMTEYELKRRLISL